MIRAHKIRLNPTPEQAAHFRVAAGIARFCFNWGLRAVKDALDRGMLIPLARSLRDAFKRISKEQFPWTFEVGKSAIEGAFVNLGMALKNFWESKRGNRKGKRMGFPKFKSRRKGYGSFYVVNDRFRVDGHTLTLSKLGRVNMAEPLRYEGKILGATIKYLAGWWWISIQGELALPTPQCYQGMAIGVDLGVKSLAVTSDGEVFENQKHLTSALRQVKRLSRVVSRRKKGSQNRKKAVLKLAKVHFKVVCQRQDGSNKLTTSLVRKAALIGIEDVNVRGMVRNHRLAQALHDAAFAEIRRQLEYKAPASGSQVVVVDCFFPSSKTCNECVSINHGLTLDMRVWACPSCGCTLDRDGNAARNIRDKALRLAHA